MSAILFFDGECTFCNRNVAFILKRDPRRYFQFASLQSVTAAKLLAPYEAMWRGKDTVILLEEGVCYVESDAVLRILPNLSGPVRFGALLLRLVPRTIRNGGYRFVAKHRHVWLGSQVSCSLPSKEDRNRFLP